MVSRITYNSSYIDDNGFAVVKYDNILNIFFYDSTADKWADPINNSFNGFGQDGLQYTNGVQDAGPISASWRTEASSATRGSGVGASNPKATFPDHAIIVVSTATRLGEITSGPVIDTAWDIIDTDTNRHWMRFENQDTGTVSTADHMLIHGPQAFTSFTSSAGRGSAVTMFNGSIIMSLNANNGYGWVKCSFAKDKAIYTQNTSRWDWDSNILDRNGGGSAGWTLFESIAFGSMSQVLGQKGAHMIELAADGKEYIALSTYGSCWLIRNTFDTQWSSIQGFNSYYFIANTDDYWFVQLLPSGKLYGYNASYVQIDVWYEVWKDADDSVNSAPNAIYDNTLPSISAQLGGDTSDEAQAFFVTENTSVLEPSSSTIFVAPHEQGVQVISTYEKNGNEGFGKTSFIEFNTIIPPVGYAANGDTTNNVGDIFGRGSPVNNFPQIMQQTRVENPMRNLGNLGFQELDFFQTSSNPDGAYLGFIARSNSTSTTVPASAQMVHEHIHNNHAANIAAKDLLNNKIDVNGLNRQSNPVIFFKGRVQNVNNYGRYITIAFNMSPFSDAAQTLGEGYISGYVWMDGPGGGSHPNRSGLYRLDGGGGVPAPVQIDDQLTETSRTNALRPIPQFYIAITPTTIKVYDVTNQPIGPGSSNNFTNDIPYLTATDSTYDGGQIHFGCAFNNDESTIINVFELTVEPPQPAYSIRGGSHRIVYIGGDKFASRDVGRLVVATTGNQNSEPTIAQDAHYQVIDMGLKYDSPTLHGENGVQLFHVSSEDDQVPDITSEWIFPAAAGPTG